MKKISIVVPVYKSQECLEELARRIDGTLRNYELILVNDCSPDKSWNVICSISKKNRNVIGINLRKNAGQDNALMAGLRQAGGEYVVIMDDDLQHDPAFIPRLYETVSTGYDVCYANFENKRQALWKNLGSWLNGKVAQAVIQKPEKIYLSPYKIIAKKLVDEIVNYDGPYPYVDGLIFRLTTSITQIDAEHRKRLAGRGNYNLIRSIRVFLKLATNFSVIPLRVSTFAGFFISVIALLLIVYYLYEYFFLGTTIEGWTTLAILILMIGGAVLVSLGMIGEYIGRIFMVLNNAPQYSIKEIIRNESAKKNI